MVFLCWGRSQLRRIWKFRRQWIVGGEGQVSVEGEDWVQAERQEEGTLFYTENGGGGKLMCSTNILGAFLILIALSVASYKNSPPPDLKNKGNFNVNVCVI